MPDPTTLQAEIDALAKLIPITRDQISSAASRLDRDPSLVSLTVQAICLGHQVGPSALESTRNSILP